MRLIWVVFLTGILAATACINGGSTAPEAVSSNVDDNAQDVSVSEAIEARFLRPIDMSTVNDSSFFIVPEPDSDGNLSALFTRFRSAINTAVCDSANALDATVECATTTSCTLTPATALDYATRYVVCLTSEIHYLNSTAFEGKSFAFTTTTEEPASESFSVGGVVSGLSGTVVLRNNGADDLSVSADGSFTFETELASGAAYAVTVQTQPATQTCVVTSGSGSLGSADVTDVSVSCSSNTYTVGGSVSGLTGTVVLQNNGGNDRSINADGSFTFSTPVSQGATYSVTVQTQPAGQTCVVTNGSGTMGSSNVTNVSVSCSAITFTVNTTAGANGAVSPNGAVSVDYGDDQAFTATPDSGYSVYQWLLDGGLAQTGGTSYTLTNVTANHTVAVSFAQAVLDASVSSLALSANDTALNAALTGNPRQITVTNNGTVAAAGVSVGSTGLPAGTTISANTCSGALAVSGTCTITVTPGSNETSNCETGIAPTNGVITVSATNAADETVNAVVLTYGCLYQGGYLYSVDDTTAASASIGGKVVTTTQQSAAILWSADSNGAYDGGVSIWGIAENSTTGTPNPSTGQVAGQTACNGRTDGACNTNNILVFYTDIANPSPLATDYAAGLCTQTISGFSDWYLPAICELGPDQFGTGSGCGTVNSPLIQNIQTNLSDNGDIGTYFSFHWSSTENSAAPQGSVWVHYFVNDGNNFQNFNDKDSTYGVLCSRLLD